MTRKLISISMFVFVLALSVSPAAQAEPDALPDFAFIEGIAAYGQTYPLSCESRSASDLAAYWGVSAPEVEFFNNLPTSDNPEKGFVGSVFGTWGQTPPNAYGVHAAPVAKLLREYGLDAQAQRGMSLNELKREIANGRPVIVWIVGHVWQGTPQDYRAKDGSTVTVAGYEHTMMAYGYDLSGIYLIDAGNASRKAYSYAVFLDSWGVLGNMAVTANGTRDVVVRTPEVGNNSIAGQYIVQKGDYLSKLAREWGIGWKDLAAINNISYPYTLYPGQVLITGIEDGLGTVSTPVPTDPPPTPRPTDPPAPTATPVPTSTPEPTPEPTPLPTDDPSSEEGGNKVEVEGGGTIDADAYIVQKGEHLMQIARKLQLSWTAIAELNGLVAPYALQPGQTLKLPGPEAGPPPPPLESGEVGGEGTYVVQAGDYLYIIARRIGVNWHQLADLNGIRAPYIVYPGQVIKLP